ncbi:hypothetical protein FRC07_010115 [Ceratobasidium sp. 392]|nr:hypothetical protein FRC07_010115 [Ceratobasidium sp. 392]
MTAAPRSNGENASLKMDSPTSIYNDGFASPRKLSDASHFSLSMFPPTPTTPLHGDIVWAGLNSANSPLRQAFSPTGEILSSPPIGLAPPFSPSLQPPSPSHHHQSAPNTPVRRATTETDRRLSYLSHTQNRAGRASTDSPAQRERIRVISFASHHPRVVPGDPSHRSFNADQPYQESPSYRTTPGRRQEQCRNHSDTVTSPVSHSAYSQDQDSDSGSCYSDDDAASVTSSMDEAIMMAREERRSSRQSRLAYMRDAAIIESPREPSWQSHESSSSDPASLGQSASPITPDDDDDLGGYLGEKTGIPLVRLEQIDVAPPTVNVISPTRKAAPRMSTVSGSTLGKLPRVTPEPELKPLRPSPSMFSLRSRAISKGRAPTMIIISHPHLNTDDALGAQVLPQGADIGGSRVTLTTDGGVGAHSLAHSRSMPVLRVPDQNIQGKKQKKVKPPFDKYGMPTTEQLRLASEMSVYDERGQPVRFGDIFEGQKTAVCFIRHFWCPLCQDYMSSIVHLTEPAFVAKAGVKLVIIGNGSPSMIKAYRSDIFHCPYEMYTDPSRQLYNALGMDLRTTDGGSEEEKGSYVKHGTFTGTMMVLKNALKMPLANAGDIKQLGGEFILGPGLTCSFTSRMHTTRSHTPIRDLLQAAGVDTTPWATDLSLLQSKADQARWMDVQNEDLDRLIRRGLQASCNEQYCALDDDVDGMGELDLGEFRRLLERLKGESPASVPTLEMEVETEPEPELEPEPQPFRTAPIVGSSYAIEVKGQKRVELDHLGAVLQSRNGSSTWEACRDRKRSTSSRPGTATSRPGTATSRPGTATSRPGTARSTVSFGRV